MGENMAMVEPVINWDNFLKDLNDGMSAYDLQHKYILTPRQYRSIMRNVVRKRGYSLKKSRVKPYKSRTKFHEPHITVKKDGKYLVRRKDVYYGQYDSLETARKVKMKLIEVNWDKSQLNKIRKEIGLKPIRSYKV